MALIEGGIYAHKERPFKWALFKVLKLDLEVAHLRLYKNRFWRRPTARAVLALEWALGHVPISRRNVESWSVHMIA